MSLIRKFQRAVRGDVDIKTVALELQRRRQAAKLGRQERANLDKLNVAMPALNPEAVTAEQLLVHYRTRKEPHFFRGFSPELSTTHRENFPGETEDLIAAARRIVNEHSWPLLGFGVKCFGKEIAWRRDPLSGHTWSLDYHRNIQLIRNDGSDARVLWEVNRLGHLLTLSRAFVVTGDEVFSQECFAQLESWAEQNPYGRGINWTCAMEAALRSLNLIAIFQILRNSSALDSMRLQLFLKLFHQHGTYITNNLEFSHLATSNHYLSDIVGLLWLGVLLPEFQDSENWRNFALTEMLREMDKQVLPDGADFESSTGYHRFVLELLLYSFILCRENQIEIETKYWNKLHLMLSFMRGYLRPDGLAPLLGDSDSGQVLPVCRRRADDHAYVLAVGAALFDDGGFRVAEVNAPPELLWILGDTGLSNFKNLSASESGGRGRPRSQQTRSQQIDGSQAFTHAGVYVMRKDDLYLAFNVSDAGLNGRGSHGHNDALSIEVNASGRAFIVDPGTYVYTADLTQRHLFRSTAYHSTVSIDGEDQNTTLQSVPFVIGNEARPKVLAWETSSEMDRVIAEHSGYQRVASPVTHRRTISFYKSERYWLIEDEFFGAGEHECEVRFHFAPGLEVCANEASATATCAKSNAALSVVSLDLQVQPELENQATSTDYGEKQASITACWRTSGALPKLRWKIVLSDMLRSFPSTRQDRSISDIITQINAHRNSRKFISGCVQDL